MKKLNSILISTVLALAAGQAVAQTVTQASVPGAAPGAPAVNQITVGSPTALAPNAGPVQTSMQPPRPTAPVVKDFAAARSFELERSKFHLGAIEKFRKCVEGAKEAADLAACQSAYRTSLNGHLNTLVKQGKMAAAYEMAPSNTVTKPVVVPGK